MSAQRAEPPPSPEELAMLRDKLLRQRETLVYAMTRDGINRALLSQLAGCQAAVVQIDVWLGNNSRPRRWS